MCKDFLGTLSKSAKQVGDGATAFDVYKTLSDAYLYYTTVVILSFRCAGKPDHRE